MVAPSSQSDIVCTVAILKVENELSRSEKACSVVQQAPMLLNAPQKTLGESSRNFNISVKLTKIQQIPLFRTKSF